MADESVEFRAVHWWFPVLILLAVDVYVHAACRAAVGVAPCHLTGWVREGFVRFALVFAFEYHFPSCRLSSVGRAIHS